MKFPASIQKLIDELSKLPTVGPKTAERFAFYLLNRSEEELKNLSRAVLELKQKTATCRYCFSIAEADPCPTCRDPKRSKEQLCIIAGSRDLMTIEATKQYGGLYFVLNGELNHIEGIGPEQINTKNLIKRLKGGQVKEVILALNPTIEGETTALYLSKLIKPLEIKVTRLARGLPMGADLEYVDELTLTNAFKFRNEI